MTVFCQAEECKWNQDGECNRGVISLDLDNECEDFESYLDDAEWQKPYWKRMIDRTADQVYRVLFHGKEIEINGRKFFVDTKSAHALVTEETTGMGCGHRDELEGRFEKIIEAIEKSDLPPLESLPIGEYDRKTGKVKPWKADPEEEKGSQQ